MKQKPTVWAWMKNAIQQVKSAMGIIPKKVRDYSSKSLELTSNIKKLLDSPVTDVLTAIIPGTWDDNLVSLMKGYLAKALPYLNIVDACKQHEDLELMLQCWIAELRKLPAHSQNAILIKLAALLTAYQDNEGLRQRLYDLYVQMDYIDKK